MDEVTTAAVCMRRTLARTSIVDLDPADRGRAQHMLAEGAALAAALAA